MKNGLDRMEKLLNEVKKQYSSKWKRLGCKCARRFGIVKVL